MERRSGVWCQVDAPYKSASRLIVERVMSHLDMNVEDHRERDPIIVAISDYVDMLMDAAQREGRKKK
jgi:hypothetical protein